MKKNVINKMRSLGILCLLGALCTSCDDWLDVRGENIQKEQDQFENYKGFRDALTGCYMTMGSQDIYGLRLTMTDIESMADLWYFTESMATGSSNSALKAQLSMHQYTEDYPLDAIKRIYGGLFTTISSANVLLKNLDEKGGNIADRKARAVIEGEAYAIRAYCQADLLRLFGQLPKGGTKTVRLPYSYTTGIDEMPAYYDYAAYVKNLTADIEKAESLLKDNDPIFEMTYSKLNSPGTTAEDTYMYYRQSRLNYWAVRALHARMALYTGDTALANQIATEIINAKGADGNALISLSSTSDLRSGYNALPNECLFYLSKYDVTDYATTQLIGGSTAQSRDYRYIISENQLGELYASIPGSTASHNHYLNLWNRSTLNPSSRVTPALKKYWFDESKLGTLASSNASTLATKVQIIPMLRLSEMYLIAMETSNSLTEVQQLYDTYMADRAYTLYTPFASLDEARAEMVNEYRRELFGEGQMFFTYKRLGAKEMMWNSEPITEDDYLVPLPATEYDPNINK